VKRSTVVAAVLAIAMSQPAVRREFGRDHPYSHQPTKPHGDAERIAAAHAKRERKNARRKAAKTCGFCRTTTGRCFGGGECDT